MKKSYYDILGIAKNAGEKEIRSAFRKLAKKYHPDTNPGNTEAEKHFKEVNEAYNVLSDPKKKKLYDTYGDMGLQEGFDPNAYEAWQRTGGGAAGGPGAGGYQSFHFDGDINDLFSGIFGGHGGGGFSGFREGGFSGARGSKGFSGFQDGSGFSGFQGGGRMRSGPVKGEDVTARVDITLEESASGCSKTCRVKGPDGKLTSLQVRIPAGIDEGQKVRLKGKGNPGINGGACGDLLLQVHILPREGMERKGQDLYVAASIPFTTAALGGEAVVPTLGGRVACRIRPGTQSGSRIRLKGKGIVSMKDPSVHGDEYVVISIEVPKDLSEEQKKLLREFEQLSGTAKTSGGGRAA